MTTTDWRELCAELTDELSGYASANPHHDSDALVTRARAALAQPVADPTDEQLLATVDGVTVTLPPLPMDHTDAHGRIAYDIAWRIAMARAVLARWGGQAAPVLVAERLPSASHVYFEFVISDADDCTQAGGIAPTYAQALSEGQHYLAQYQQDGPHTLELRRVEVLPPGALPEQRYPAPVPVSERLPGPEDCDAEGRCWLFSKVEKEWRLIDAGNPGVPHLKYCFTHWLPATALPLPQGEVEA